jgi:adenosylmethionine-8-amino-7-oxononanoate aminotransferase
MDLVAADRAHLWHPFTQQRGWAEEEPLIVARAEGTDLIDVSPPRSLPRRSTRGSWASSTSCARSFTGTPTRANVREVRRRGFMVGIELRDYPLEAPMGHRITL